MLRKLLLSATIAATGLFAAQAASAADMPVKAAPRMAVPAWSWTGFYVGVNGGVGGNETKYPFNAPTLATSGEARITSSGGLAGGQIGYNWQFGNWVAGVEADLDWSSIEAKLSANAATPVGGLNFSTGTEVDWFGTVRGRLGYAVWERALLYATGGWAFGHTTTKLNFAAPGVGFAFSQGNDKSGWTAGAGFEYAVLPNVTFKAEYMYVDLGTDNVFNGVALGVLPLRVDEHTTFHVARAGINWRFWTH